MPILDNRIISLDPALSGNGLASFEPSFLDTLEAIFNSTNVLGASLASNIPKRGLFDAENEDFFKYDPDFDVHRAMRGYEYAASSFIDVFNERHAGAVRANIDQEQEFAQVFKDAPMWKMLVTGLLSEIVDPVNLLFLPLYPISGTIGLLKGTVRTAKVAFTSETSRQILLSKTQETRTLEQSLMEIALVTGFAPGLYLGAMAMRRAWNGATPAQRENIASKVEAEFKTGDANAGVPDDLWFAGSKIVDSNGEPLTVYHGTGADIERFSGPSYFTDNPDAAGTYSWAGGGRHPSGITFLKEDGVIYPVYLSIKNPKIIEDHSWWAKIRAKALKKRLNREITSAISQEKVDTLKKQGYDGIVNKQTKEIIAFDSDQIRFKFYNPKIDETMESIRQRRVSSQVDAKSQGQRQDSIISESRVFDHESRSGSSPSDSLGLGETISVTTPGFRSMYSDYGSVRDTAAKLVRTAITTIDNWKSIASEQPVESLAMLNNYAMAQELTLMTDAFLRYRKRMTGEKTGSIRAQVSDSLARLQGQQEATERLTMTEFREQISDALRAGGAHNIPEVAEAAKGARIIIDEITDQAQKVGLLDKNLGGIKGNKGYVPRMWFPDAVRDQTEELVDLIHWWQGENLPAAERRSLKDLRTQVEQIVLSPFGIEGHNMTKMPKGMFQERTIVMDDTVLARHGFLENDIDSILRSYVHTASVDIELKRAFGSVGMESQIADIRMEAVSKAKSGEIITVTSKEYDPKLADIIRRESNQEFDADIDFSRAYKEVKLKSTKKAEEHVTDIEAMRDILRGVYNIPDNPYAPLSVAARLALDFNNVTMLGKVVISSLPDMGRIVMVNGMKHAFPTLKLIIKDFAAFKMSAKDTMLAGTSLDMLLQQRAMALANMGALPNRFTKIERITGYANNMYFMAVLLSPWNDFIKKAAGVAATSRMLDDMILWGKGTISESGKARLAKAGINEDTSTRIVAMFKEHGDTVHGVKMANTSKWKEGAQAKRTFLAALSQEVDSTIITPGAGDLPLWMHKEWGRLVGQYKSFLFASAEKVMVSGLQYRDAQALHGAMMMVFIGGLVVNLKDRMVGIDPDESVDGFLINGFDQSGLSGWFFNINNIVEDFTDNNLGIRPATGNAPPYGASTRWKAGQIFGPTASQAMRAGSVIGDFVSGKFDYKTRRDITRLWPGNNHFIFGLGNIAKTQRSMEAIEDPALNIRY